MKTQSKPTGRINLATQAGRILAALTAAQGDWVSMPKLVKVSGSYNVHTRIDELRHRLGAEIENKCDNDSMAKNSSYRLVRLPL